MLSKAKMPNKGRQRDDLPVGSRQSGRACGWCYEVR